MSKKNEISKRSSYGLEWIKKHRSILNIQGLEIFTNLPPDIISKFFHTGYFPEKWKDHLDQEIEIVRNDGVILQDYIKKLLDHHKKCYPNKKATTSNGPSKNLERAAQILTDLAQLQEILKKTNNRTRFFLHEEAVRKLGQELGNLFDPNK